MFSWDCSPIKWGVILSLGMSWTDLNTQGSVAWAIIVRSGVFFITKGFIDEDWVVPNPRKLGNRTSYSVYSIAAATAMICPAVSISQPNCAEAYQKLVCVIAIPLPTLDSVDLGVNWFVCIVHVRFNRINKIFMIITHEKKTCRTWFLVNDMKESLRFFCKLITSFYKSYWLDSRVQLKNHIRSFTVRF